MTRSQVVALLLAVIVPSTSQAATWAKDLFGERQHDFGRVNRGEKPSYDFLITNNTSRDVRIKAINVSCSCTTAMASQGRLEPGQSTLLTCVMDTTGFQGSKSVSIYVVFDRPWRAEVPLRVSCESVGQVGSEAIEVDFGIVPQGIMQQKRINLDYSGPLDWRVMDLDFGNPNFTTEVREISRESGKVRYELDIKMLAGALAGIIEDTIRVHTNDPAHPIVTVKAKAQVEADVVVTPASIRLGELQPGQTVERKVMIKAANPFKVVRVDNAEGMFQFKTGEEAKTVQLVVLTLTVPTKMDEIPGHVDIVTDLGGERVLSVDLQK